MVSFTREQNSICRSRGGLSANEKEEAFASNVNLFICHKDLLFNRG